MNMNHLKPLNLPVCSMLAGRIVIAGPCSAESEHELLGCASEIAALHMTGALRAGIWKPRTRPGGFEGVGPEALPWLQKASELSGMPVGTEVATPEHVKAAIKHCVSYLWIGARTAGDPFAMQMLADCIGRECPDIPVLVKNPLNPDLDLWTGALLRLYMAGVRRLGAIHRGFSVQRSAPYRNAPLWQIPLQLHRKFPHLPLLHDPSHTGGTRALIAPLCQAAIDLGFDGLMIECHRNPACAMSDGGQQVTPAELKKILLGLKVRSAGNTDNTINALRLQIDEIDNELVALLAKRMELTDAVGHCKLEANMPVLQPERYQRLLTTLLDRGQSAGIHPDFLRGILESIHEESIRRQLDIMNAPC